MGRDEAPQGLSDDQRTLIGHFQLDAEHKILWRGAEVVPVGPKVVETLAVLAENWGQVVSREQLLRTVWGGATVEESNLSHNISVLRKILKGDPTCPNIETVPRRGYRLCMPAHKIRAASNEASQTSPAVVGFAGRRSWQKPIIATLLILCTVAIASTALHLHYAGRRRLSSNPEAVRLYAEAVARLHSFDAVGAKALLLQVIKVDPSYAPGHAALAEALGVLGYETQARDEARTAFELAGNFGAEERLAIEGRYRFTTKDWEGAVRVYQTLHALAPDNLDYGLWLASSQTAASNGQASLQTLAVLRRLPPPEGNDPRISLKEYEAWKSLGDFAHMETALAEAADASREQGALLLLARARSRQCWVERVRGKAALALDHCREAKEIYTAAGDHRGEAESLRFLADILSASDIDAAISEYRQALALEHEIGHLGGEATVITQLGTLYSNQGEHEIAKKSFEQAMKIFEEQGDIAAATGLSVDLAGELTAQGQLADGDEIYRKALDSAVRIHDKYIQAVVQYDLGFDQAVEGDLESAAASYRQALTLFQEAGDKEHDISLVKSLGEVAMLQGDVATARGYFQQAMNMPGASQHKLQVAEAEMDLDQLALDEGRDASALEPSIRRIADVFRQGEDERFNNALDDQALSLALLSRCLLSERQMAAALHTIHQAVLVAMKAAPDVRLTVAVDAARIDFAGGTTKERSRTLSDLENVVAEAQRLRYPVVDLDAQLALGELELQSGALTRGRTRLQTVAAEASRRHYLLIARKARPSA